MGGQPSKERQEVIESTTAEDLSVLQNFVEKLKITFDSSFITQGVAVFVQAKVEELQSFLTEKIEEAGEKNVHQEEDLEQALEESSKDIHDFVEKAQTDINEKMLEEKDSMPDPKLKAILTELEQLLREFNTVAVSRKEWADFIDHEILHQSTGLYVISSESGYFANNNVPACQMLKVITALVEALAEEGKPRLTNLIRSNELFEKAWWNGVDPNTDELKKDFLVLRRDPSAYSHESYNQRLGTISVNAERLHDGYNESQVIERNVCSAIKYIALVCSQPNTQPLQTTPQEQHIFIGKIKSALAFAHQRQKRVRIQTTT